MLEIEELCAHSRLDPGERGANPVTLRAVVLAAGNGDLLLKKLGDRTVLECVVANAVSYTHLTLPTILRV